MKITITNEHLSLFQSNETAIRIVQHLIFQEGSATISHASMEVSRQKFRTALDRLEETGLIRTSSTNKGTKAALTCIAKEEDDKLTPWERKMEKIWRKILKSMSPEYQEAVARYYNEGIRWVDLDEDVRATITHHGRTNGFIDSPTSKD